MPACEELWLNLPGDYKAYARYWPGCGERRGAVLYHHGIQSHCGWYVQSAGLLADQGWDVLQVDRRGCGRNEVARGHAESANQLIEDALAGRDELLRRSGAGGYFLLGVSWGGKLAVAQYVTDPDRVRGMALVTPGLFPLVGVTKEEQSEIGFSMLYEPERHFRIPLDAPDLFTRAPEWQHFIRKDELTLQSCTAAFYLASRRMDRIVARLSEAPEIPLGLFLAGDERIIDNERTESYVRDLGWKRAELFRFDSARHSLEFETESGYFAQLSEWFQRAERAQP